MTDGDHKSDGDGTGRAREHGNDLERRLDQLSGRLKAKDEQDKAARAGRRESDATGMAKALRLSSEFVAGVVVGGGIGFLFDKMAGTSPWGLIVFLLLGFGAGVLNVMRTAGVVAEPGTRRPDEGK